MQTLIVTLLLIGTLTFAIKLSLLPRWAWIGWGGATAVATGLADPITSAQSKTQIADFLQNPTLMADASVLLTIEVCLMVAWCVVENRRPQGADLHWWSKAIRGLLSAFPGIVVFVALFAAQTQLMFALTGTSFALISWGMAAVVLLLVPALAWAIGWVLPSRSMRFEWLFMLSLIMGGLGVVATVNGRTAVEGTATVDWAQLLTILSLCLIGTAAGWMLYRQHKNRLKNK